MIKTISVNNVSCDGDRKMTVNITISIQGGSLTRCLPLIFSQMGSLLAPYSEPDAFRIWLRIEIFTIFYWLSLLFIAESWYCTPRIVWYASFTAGSYKCMAFVQKLWPAGHWSKNRLCMENFKRVKNLGCLRLNFWLSVVNNNGESILGIPNSEDSKKIRKNSKSSLGVSIGTRMSRLIKKRVKNFIGLSL